MKRWSKEECDIMRLHYPHSSMKEMMKLLPGRSEIAINSRAFILSLKKTKEYIKTMESAGRFKKGMIPHSKGKKREEYMSAAGIEKCKLTQFKKGNKSHRYLPVGTEMEVSGYMYVKVADTPNVRKCDNWKLKHRLLWESVNGEIPEGHNIQFKDGNPKNIVIENLYMISRREQMKANSYKNLPDDAQRLLYAVRILTRQINKMEKNEQKY